MSNPNLRPVSQSSHSPTASSTSTSPVDSKPLMQGSPTSPRLRRPMSPSSLRDVDLNHGPDGPARFYPAPHTGHELMALFPPAPPAPFDGNMGSTNCFRREERAFFAQGPGDPSRVRVDLDPSQMSDRKPGREKGKRRDSSSSGRPYLPSPPHGYNMAPGYPPHPDSRSSRGPPPPSFQPSPHGQHSQPPPNPHLYPHAHHSPPHDPSHPGTPGTKPEHHPEDIRDGDDEAWRRPMAHSERRRAGKHTKRVIVRT